MYKKEDDFKMILEYKEEIALLRMQVAEEQAQKYAAYVRIDQLIKELNIEKGRYLNGRSTIL
ncbi:MAG: hypothetical protein ACKVJK_12790 [Methylophagaceae bacterium]|jgi:hypothetical protein|tara:strand:+ start:198 stop:383 length:186 start_codon:yes stop_codon:yes gene_type:complete